MLIRLRRFAIERIFTAVIFIGCRTMAKAIILMMDSFGIGGAKDADRFDDVGANTFLHIAENYENFSVPNLQALGLQKAGTVACGKQAPLTEGKALLNLGAKYGAMEEISAGKDTISGHWEMAGVPVYKDFGHFKLDYPSFPDELIERICKRAGIKGILGNKAASGTVIIQELGEEHIATDKPIFYTSADSNLQIAAHEELFGTKSISDVGELKGLVGLERLYKLCEIVFEEVKPYNIGRVIARPFVGQKNGEFVRTKNRHDYALTPFEPTILDKAKEKGLEVTAIGKIRDIYAGSGVTRAVKASGLKELWDVTLEEIKLMGDKDGIVFTNFVDFDMEWGHRRDVKGYAEGLMYFDKRLPDILKVLHDDDVVFITADHGCDPTYKGTDHTRECVPILMFGKNVKAENLGRRQTYADIAATIAEKFDLQPFNVGKSFL